MRTSRPITQLPDGSGRKVELRLTDKSRITVRISDDSDVQPSSI